MKRSVKPKKSYVNGPYGQVHLLSAGDSETKTPPLYLLHATAYSGGTFQPLMEKLAAARRVYAPDTPGYGGSDRPDTVPEFKNYGAAFVDLIEKTTSASNQPVDVFGYHTGVFVALEAAALRPDLIRSLILIGIPFFKGQAREEWRAKLAHKTDLSEDFDQFRDRWHYFIRDRTPGLSLERAFACFVDELRVYPDHWWAHEALFSYDTESCLRAVSCPVLVLNPDSPLAESSRAAAQLMKTARLKELPSLSGAIFDLGTDLLCAEVEAFLDSVDV